MIRVSSLSVGSRLLPLSLTVEQGEILHVIGPNGSGKSTFLSAVSGLLEHGGDVTIADLNVQQASVEALASYRAFLSQSDRPAFNLVVAQYLMLSVPTRAQKQLNVVDGVVRDLAQLLELEDKLMRPIHHLSGGEWQRVRLCAICLQVWPTLNPDAKVLMLDEPAAPLDIGQEGLLYKLIRTVADMGITVVMSNHDLNRTLHNADKVLMLDNGVLQQWGTPEDVLSEEELARVFKTSVTKAWVNDKPVLIFE